MAAKIGGEYGVTTGRPRRTGWFDTVVARYATRVNGITDYFLTKLDVLSSLDKVPVCVAYEIDGRRHHELPMTQTEFITPGRCMSTWTDGGKTSRRPGRSAICRRTPSGMCRPSRR